MELKNAESGGLVERLREREKGSLYPRNLFKVSTPSPRGNKHKPADHYPLPTSKSVGKMACYIEYEVDEEAATGFFKSICEDSNLNTIVQILLVSF